VTRVAGDSNPILVGPELDLLSPAALCLHLALLLGVAAWLGLALLAVHALRGGSLGRLALAAAAGLVLAALLPRTGLVVALVGAALLVCGARLRVLLADERFTSFALAGFLLAALAATLNSEAIHREYFREKQVLAQERAAEILAPDDDLRRFVLEEVLGKLGGDPALQRGLLSERESERSALAFRVWAQSMLSHLGYSCQVRVYDAFGTPASEFAVDMPLGRDVSARDLIERARVEAAPITRTDVEASISGRVRLYSGAVSVKPGGEGREPLGWVVIDLPFAHASLDLAANPRARTPEVLRNLQEEGIGPRIEDSERLLLAWLERGYVVESSTPYLEVGQALQGSVGDGAWHELHLVNGDYLVQHVQAGERVLLAGFRLATPVDRLLEWTQVGSFSFAAVFGVLLAFLVVTRGLGLTGRLPRLLVPKRLGFQQKLMMAFLIVSLLPSVVLSLATRDIMRDRSLRRNRDAALAKARSAEAALADLVRRDLDAVRESEYLRAVLTVPEQPPARDIGHLEFSQIMVFRDDGSIILDETLSNLSDEEARSFVVGAPHEVFASRDGRHLYLGALVRVWYSPTEILSESAPDAQPYYLYYRRRLTDKLLRNLAPILNADISGFLGAQLAVSSQKSLATAGLMPSLVPPEAFAHVQVRRNRYAVVEERTGRQRYFTGYLPLEDGRGRRIGSLAVSQLLQPDEFAIEVERTRGLVVGLSTLMFVLTLLLGVVFAARIFDPVRSLIEGTRRIAGGDLAFRLRARGGDEIGELERSFNDMAARLQAARWALEERRRYLEAVLGHIASGVIATDAHGRITAANPAAYRILQMPQGGLEGHAWSEPGLGAAGMAHFWSRLAAAPDGEVVEIPLVLRAGGAAGPADGGAGPASERLTLRVVVTDLLPPGAAAGEPWGRVAIFEDVTELIRSKKLSAWAEMARQVAHEIKNPLTPMKLSAQFVQQAYEDQSAKFPQIFHESMATIIAQVESLRRIATEFANFGRVQKLEPRPLDLGTLLRRVTAAYGRIEGLHLEVLDGADGAAPAGDRFPGDGVLVLGDEDGLRRVFSNVLENAREAMGGRGHIALRVLPPSGGRVQVRIDDHGSGLSEEAAARLFEPYFSTKTTGTGLGLAITKGILEELGGSIALTNRAGGGVETRITLVVC
jgi:signal transduction histidine kinase